MFIRVKNTVNENTKAEIMSKANLGFVGLILGKNAHDELQDILEKEHKLK